MGIYEAAGAVTVAVWGVGVVATLVLGARAARRSAERTVWAPAALAALTVCLSHVPTTLGGVPDAVAWPLVVAATVLLTASVTALIRQHETVGLLRTWLDVLASALLLVAVVLAAAAGPVRRSTGLSASAASLLLTAPACALLVALFGALGLHLTGAARTTRSQLVIGALAVLAAAEIATTLQRVGLLDAGTWPDVRQGGAALALVLLALASRTPAPDVVPADEKARALVLGPVVDLLIAGIVLGVDHAVGLPTAPVVLALCAMAVQLVRVVLGYRVVTSLNGSHRQARTDDLTGLGNRRALAAALAGVEAGSPLALTLVDLDRFKEVNDVLGHDAGDELLRQVAARLLLGAAGDETVVRQGGDEFALVRPGGDAAGAAARAADLVAALSAPFALGGRQVSVAASVGVAAAPEHCASSEDLLRAADAAMYRAKAAGGGVVVYDAAVDAERHAAAELLADLREAVVGDGLDVHFQPQLDAVTGALVGVEALVRWPHPTRGLLPPAVFLPLVERSGLMDALTRQVLGRALAAKSSIDGGAGARMSVNVSATSLLDPHLVSTVAAALLEHAVPPGELMLEITETELMLDAVVSRRVIAELVELGVGVSIDDYGTGHSSLSYLKDLPAAELKLDRSFVAELGTDPRIATIVRSTVDLAHSLGLRLVAEGVEDAATLERLRDLGVDVTQGYHHSRPVPAAELARWAARHRAGDLSDADAGAGR